MMGFGGFGLGTMGMFGGLGMLLGVLFWVGVLYLLVWAAGALVTRREEPVEPAPLELLRRRFARGEIGEAEFEQAKRVLA
jgi:putative membrane protein